MSPKKFLTGIGLFILILLVSSSCMNPYMWTGERATAKGQTKQNAYYKKAKKYKHDESWRN